MLTLSLRSQSVRLSLILRLNLIYQPYLLYISSNYIFYFYTVIYIVFNLSNKSFIILVSSILFIAKHFLPKSLKDAPEWYNILLSITINLSWNISVFIIYRLLYCFSYFFLAVLSIFSVYTLMLTLIFLIISNSFLPA